MSGTRIYKTIAVVFISILTCNTLAATHYVDLSNPTPQSPYLTWATAATNIQHAVDVTTQGDTVLVSNGTYNITSQIVVTNGITLASVNGPGQTVVDANYSCRCFLLSHDQTLLSGFTVTKGFENNGAGIHCQNATIEHCILSSNQLANGDFPSGGGLYIEKNGCIRYSQVIGNFSANGAPEYYPFYYGGAGIFCNSSRVESCIIQCNSIRNTGGYPGVLSGGGAYISDSSTVIDSIFANNSITGSWYFDYTARGGGIYATANNQIINCTIVGNSVHFYDTSISFLKKDTGYGGGVYLEGSNAIQNCIIYDNDCSANDIDGDVTSPFLDASFCCTPTVLDGLGNITNGPQLQADFILSNTSPCIDAGSNINAPTNDVFGVFRPLDGYGDNLKITDIGATEFAPPATFPALLTNSQVSPAIGSIFSNFTFSIHYSSTALPPPVFSAVSINGIYYQMRMDSGSANDGTYKYTSKLPGGTPPYYFLFGSSTGGVTRYPATGAFTDLTVVRAITLVAGSVTPETGYTATTFSFRVTCENPDSAQMSRQTIMLNDIAYDMSLESGTPQNAIYVYSTPLAAGEYEYYFLFNNNTTETRLPAEGVFTGPTVNSTQHFVSATGSNIWPFSTLETASTNIQNALAIADDNETVIVDSGTYNLAAPITVSNAIILRGIDTPETTILTAITTTPCIILANANAVVENLTVSHGRGVNGGGIQCSNGTIRHCVVSGCLAEKGGGIYLYQGLVHDTSVNGNTASSGGGVYAENGTVRTCVFESNTAGCGGGAYLAGDGTLALCSLTANSATNTDYPNGGGAVYCENGGTIQQCQIITNTADYGGGVLCYNGGYLENNLLIDNHASSYGGGVASIGGYELQNCTIVDNTAGISAGGAGLFGANEGFIRNCIIYSNTVAGLAANYTIRDGLNISFSCVQPATNNVGNIAVGPKFLDYSAGLYCLATNSPCVDSGTSTGAPNADIEGTTCPLDGNEDGMAEMDIGAYEMIPNGMSLIGHTTEEQPAETETSFTIRWMGYTNHYYSLVTTTNLLSDSMTYIPSYSNTPGVNAIVAYTNTALQPEAYFRILVSTNTP